LKGAFENRAVAQAFQARPHNRAAAPLMRLLVLQNRMDFVVYDNVQPTAEVAGVDHTLPP
jgi:hypothetical protein